MISNNLNSIEFNDDTGYLFMNSTGGYTKYTEVDGVKYADVLNRNGKLIQNGFLLKPSKDTNNYGVVRMSVATEEFNKELQEAIEGKYEFIGESSNITQNIYIRIPVKKLTYNLWGNLFSIGLTT